ncbi:SDR family oxidoreductase [uncultured Erythrobacter sp.]|uniref:SDR family oxidoreductase n=1 Tax=uncultured Erythrobacter sp. TaxID=263913 RepID=UPI002619AE34|nr:SDR family oxidoreductase [uncultured Erythrobacter sp.]
MKNVFLVTGGAGFLGSQIVKELLLRGQDVVCLVRSDSSERTVAKIAQSVVRSHGDAAGSAHTIRGDVTQAMCGIAEADLDRIGPSLTAIIHCAALVNFLVPRETLERNNVGGTRNIIELARQCGKIGAGAPIPVHHVSTAYVAGKTSDTILETDHEGPHEVPAFRNGYERSKYLAEQALREAHDVPWSIYRPSIVVGSAEEESPEPGHSLAPILKALRKSKGRVVPINQKSRIDFVNVDYVAKAVAQLACAGESSGRTYHLVSSGQHKVHLRSILSIVNREYRNGKPSLIPIPTMLYTWVLAPLLKIRSSTDARKVEQLASPFVPYVAQHPRFDDSNAQAALVQYGLKPAEPIDLFARIARGDAGNVPAKRNRKRHTAPASVSASA